ncbi:MAG: hypothetical protein ABIJ42_03190, partial [Acidobacteriota bacterium]
MKFRIFMTAVFLGFFVFPAPVLSADLWHLLDAENGNTLAYVYRDGTDTVCYSPSWKRLRTEKRDSQEEIECSYYSSGSLMILVHLNFIDDKPEGYWLLVHPQASTKKDYKVQRVEVESGWMPWMVLRDREDEIVDVFGELKEKVNSLTREEFEGDWIKSVEPDYYAFLNLLLYKGEDFGFTLEERKRKAGLIYDSLKEAPDIDLSATYKQVLSDITEKYPWFKMKRGVLFFPSLDNPGVTQITLEKLIPRLIFNTSSILKDYDPVKFKYYLAQSLMYEYFQYNSSFAGVGEVEDYILLSVSLYLISNLDYGKPADYLFLDNEEALEGIKARYHETRKNFMKETRGGQTWRRAKGEKLSEYYYLAYQFGGLLLEVYKPEDL